MKILHFHRCSRLPSVQIYMLPSLYKAICLLTLWDFQFPHSPTESFNFCTSVEQKQCLITVLICISLIVVRLRIFSYVYHHLYIFFCDLPIYHHCLIFCWLQYVSWIFLRSLLWLWFYDCRYWSSLQIFLPDSDSPFCWVRGRGITCLSTL